MDGKARDINVPFGFDERKGKGPGESESERAGGGGSKTLTYAEAMEAIEECFMDKRPEKSQTVVCAGNARKAFTGIPYLMKRARARVVINTTSEGGEHGESSYTFFILIALDGARNMPIVDFIKRNECCGALELKMRIDRLVGWLCRNVCDNRVE